MLELVVALALSQAAPAPKSPTVKYVVREAEAPRFPILGHRSAVSLLLNASNGSRSVALEKLHLGCGAEVPEHAHDQSDELLYVESGAMDVVIGGEHVHAQQGDAVFIPAGVKHSAKIVPSRPGAQDDGCGVEAVQIYSPPGPEQRYVQAAKK